MGYLPIFLDVTGRRCVVIGGGEVAERKIASLLEAGAEVIVISPEATGAIANWAAAKRIAHFARACQPRDIANASLIFAATDDAALHRAIASEARAAGILINVADEPELCTFIAPAVASRGALQIAISTSGAVPALAARVRREIEEQIGIEYAIALQILGAARTWLRTRIDSQSERARIMKALANSDLPAHIRREDPAAIDIVLANVIGEGASLAAIGIELPLLNSAAAHAVSR